MRTNVPSTRRRFSKSAVFCVVSLLGAACSKSKRAIRSPNDRLPEGEMQTVTSADGTRIAFWSSGNGSPILLVHGATASHETTWSLVQPALEARFRVHAMDRRGRGGSADSADYTLQREAEDVAAIVESLGEPVHVVGHSYGALCALEAALLTRHFRSLVLYEGVPLRGAGLYPPGTLDEMEALVEAEDAEGALVLMYRDVAGFTPEAIEQMRVDQPDAWAVRLGNIATAARELRSEERYAFDATRFANMKTPTTLLVGANSPPHELENASQVAASLPDARVVVLPGQGHAAMYTAPDLFTRELIEALDS
jgi:pimeloyl-ACP methyl ester carboxylesterase